MLGLTPLGLLHTAISLVALVYGVIALVQDKQITLGTSAGRIYIGATAVTAATGLGIFQHGGFGPPHVLSLLTLATLAVGLLAATSSVFGRLSTYVQALSFSTTFLFHLIPGVTETSTRLPPGAPLVASADAPGLKAVYGVLALGLLIGLVFQLRWLHGRRTV